LEFFFFQAEDGIRYLTVTGVQTCALPISRVATPDLLARGSAAALPAVPGVDGAAPANAPRHWRGRSLFAPCCERDGRGLQARARTDHDRRWSARPLRQCACTFHPPACRNPRQRAASPSRGGAHAAPRGRGSAARFGHRRARACKRRVALSALARRALRLHRSGAQFPSTRSGDSFMKSKTIFAAVAAALFG